MSFRFPLVEMEALEPPALYMIFFDISVLSKNADAAMLSAGSSGDADL
jgi:hypothetical protein